MPVNIADGAQATAPPKRTPRASSAVTKKTGANEEALNGLGQIASFGLVMAGQHADAGAMAKHWPGVAHELAGLAEKNEKVASLIGYLTEAGPYAGIITAVMPLTLQILANHGRVPAEKLGMAGVVSPVVLEHSVKAEMAAAELEAEQHMAEINAQLERQRASTVEDI